MHSAVDSSRGSRRPELDRQCTHARLHAYVSSQVRQIGASRPGLEVVDEPRRRRGDGAHRGLLDHAGAARASRARARTPAARRPTTPATRHASRPLGCSASACTTASSLRVLRNDSRRVPKWYASAPNGSGRSATWRSDAPRALEVERPSRSVDAAHAVDRDVLHQEVRLDELHGGRRRGSRLGRGFDVGRRRRGRRRSARSRACAGSPRSCLQSSGTIIAARSRMQGDRYRSEFSFARITTPRLAVFALLSQGQFRESGTCSTAKRSTSSYSEAAWPG